MKSFLALLLAASLTGCVHTEYKSADGSTFSRTALLSPTSVGEVKIGDKQATMTGYKSETAQVVAAAFEAGVKAASVIAK